jgi:hypothetical protein
MRVIPFRCRDCIYVSYMHACMKMFMHGGTRYLSDQHACAIKVGHNIKVVHVNELIPSKCKGLSLTFSLFLSI